MKNKQSKLPLIIFVISVWVSLFFLSGQFIDYYHFELTGALFELLYLPSLMGMFFILVFSIIRILKEKFTFKSLYVYSFLVIALTFVYVVLFRQ